MVFFLFILSFTLLFPGPENIKFETISLEQGLSQASVNCIIQDRRGFMWFGTQDGLNRYDGYGFTIYRHRPGIPNSLSGNSIIAILEDPQDEVFWVGTNGGGISKFAPFEWRFNPYRHIPNTVNSLSSRNVSAFVEDSDGMLWIGTREGGLNKLDRHTDCFTHYRHDVHNPHSLSHDSVYALYHDPKEKDILWIGTLAGGLDRFNKKSGSFTHYRSHPQAPAPPAPWAMIPYPQFVKTKPVYCGWGQPVD